MTFSYRRRIDIKVNYRIKYGTLSEAEKAREGEAATEEVDDEDVLKGEMLYLLKSPTREEITKETTTTNRMKEEKEKNIYQKEVFDGYQKRSRKHLCTKSSCLREEIVLING